MGKLYPMHIRYSIFLGNLLILVLPACDKDTIHIDGGLLEAQDFYDCRPTGGYSAAALREAMRGTWTWYQQESFGWGGDRRDLFTHRGFSFTLTSDSTFLAREADGREQVFQYTLVETPDGGAIWSIEPFDYRLRGTLYICSNALLFQNTPVDGTDSYYVREGNLASIWKPCTPGQANCF